MPPHVLKRANKAVSKPAQGFVLPVILAVGLITILLGAMMIERSSQNRITAIAQKANARSSAAAEYGIAQVQALLNRYRPLVTACSNRDFGPSCNTTPTSAWSDIPNVKLDPCSTNPNEPTVRVQSYANQQWSNVSSNPEDGQFRLVSYQYQPNATNPDIGTGTVVVEGQINPDDAVRLARTQLKADFSITRTPGIGNLPGLWVQDNQAVGVSDTVKLLANVRDSTCPKDIKSSEPIQQLQGQIQPAYAYQSAPGTAFPELTSEVSGSSFTPRTGSIAIGAIDDLSHSLPIPPQSEQSQTNSTSTIDSSDVTYSVRAKDKGGLSINLTNSAAILKVGTGSDTVVLDLEGGITLTGGGKILLASGSKLIIYARGPVTLAGTETAPAIEQEGLPSATRTQLYVSESASEVSLSGDAKPLYLILFAPASKVTTSAQVQGSIWAKSWEGKDSAVVKEAPISLSDLKLIWPPHISPITAWQRQENS
jgi:Tfp pilus assembly protein PilX